MPAETKTMWQSPVLVRWVVRVGVVVLLVIAGWTWFIEIYSFQADPGLPPTGQIHHLARPSVEGTDRLILHWPVVGDKARDFLRMEGKGATLLQIEGEGATNPELGPQAVWREYIKWWGVLMILTGVLMLFIKMAFEPVNDETTVMHLKGDTDTAQRAKGERG